MLYWRISNIKNGKINYDQNRDRAPLKDLPHFPNLQIFVNNIYALLYVKYRGEI